MLKRSNFSNVWISCIAVKDNSYDAIKKVHFPVSIYAKHIKAIHPLKNSTWEEFKDDFPGAKTVIDTDDTVYLVTAKYEDILKELGI